MGGVSVDHLKPAHVFTDEPVELTRALRRARPAGVPGARPSAEGSGTVADSEFRPGRSETWSEDTVPVIAKCSRFGRVIKL